MPNMERFMSTLLQPRRPGQQRGGYINVIEISWLGNFKGQAEQASPVEDAMAMPPSRRMGRFLGGFAQETIGLASVHNAVKARRWVEQYRLEGNVPAMGSRDSSRLYGHRSDIRTPNVTLASAFSYAPTTCPWLWSLVEPQADLIERGNGPMERIILQSCCSAISCCLSYYVVWTVHWRALRASNWAVKIRCQVKPANHEMHSATADSVARRDICICLAGLSHDGSGQNPPYNSRTTETQDAQNTMANMDLRNDKTRLRLGAVLYLLEAPTARIPLQH
ncbi:hypothetical protein BKA56DRAFT_720442 [Ilyonectria sp. MPI-CAGE-AT-0026]|nr:hypothetical protein BKA56DRAFT_720442 [Ilyonectria sp. MPI-CAGE-AT-0026]